MKIKFDTSFARRDTERRARHGRPWIASEYEALRELFMQGKTLQEICVALHRPADGTLNKLREQHLLRFDSVSFCDYYVALPFNHPGRLLEPAPQLATTKEEPVMSKNLIESKVFVNGIDATGMSDTEIFSLIAKTEAEIAKLRAIKTVSKKLSGAISKLEADVVKLAEYVDSRE